MTLTRKGSRLLVIDGVQYRWVVAPNDEPGVGIVVELASLPACRLVSWVDHGVVISPGLVRRAILDAAAAGWRPNERRPDFVRRVPEFSESLAAIHQCPACDYFSLPKRGQYEICPVCFWEDDGLDLDRIDVVSGPNHLTLREARANFRQIGACDLDAREHVLDESSRNRFRHALRQSPGLT
jgi:hypothetical protein